MAKDSDSAGTPESSVIELSSICLPGSMNRGAYGKIISIFERDLEASQNEAVRDHIKEIILRLKLGYETQNNEKYDAKVWVRARSLARADENYDLSNPVSRVEEASKYPFAYVFCLRHYIRESEKELPMPFVIGQVFGYRNDLEKKLAESQKPERAEKGLLNLYGSFFGSSEQGKITGSIDKTNIRFVRTMERSDLGKADRVKLIEFQGYSERPGVYSGDWRFSEVKEDEFQRGKFSLVLDFVVR